MTNLIMTGLLALSTGALMSTHLRRIRAAHRLLWLMFTVEVALLAILVFTEGPSSQWWLPVVLTIIAGLNVAFWLMTVVHSLNSSKEHT